MLVAQNATLSLWEENLEQLSADEEERNWEDELEVLSARLQEPVNINTATKRQLEVISFPYGYSNRKYFGVCLYKRADADSL